MSRSRGKDIFSFRGAAHRAIILASTTTLGGIVLDPVRSLAAPIGAVGTVSYQIPPQPLATALTAFGTQSGWAVSVPNELLAGLKSHGVQGQQSPASALATLLGGSGLSYQITGPRSAVVSKASAAIMLGPVRVGGVVHDGPPSTAVIGNLPPTFPGGEIARGGQLGMLGNKDIMDTPFNATSYTEQFIKSRQLRSVRDALKDDPSVRSTIATGTAGVETFMMRGFQTLGAADISYGGLYGVLPNFSVLTEMVERVEILHGPAALMNGMAPGGNIGGVVNVVPKRAHDKPISEIEADYSSNTQFGGHADVGRRFGKEKQFGLRVNGMVRSGATPIERNSMQTALTSVGADARFSNVRLSGDFGYQYRDLNGVIPYLTVGNGLPLPSAGKVYRNLGASWGELKSSAFFGVFRGEIDLLKNVTAYGSVGALSEDNRGIFPSFVTLQDTRGNASIRANANAYAYQNNTADLGVRAKIKIKKITNELVFSANRYYSDYDQYYKTLNSQSVNIYRESNLQKYDERIPNHLPHSSSTTLSSLAFADTVSALEKRIQVTAGLRVQRVQSVNFNTTTGARTSSYDRTAVSPSVMAVFKPLKNVAIYGNWIQGIQQGTTVGTTYANAGQIFAPYKSTQYEVGVKGDIGRFVATFDVFQISQPSTIYDVNTNIMSLNSEQRNRGLELNLAGEVIHGLHVTGGLMLLDPRLTKTQGGLTNGRKASGTSTVNFNTGLSYDIPRIVGLSFTSDIIYTSSQYIDTNSPRRSIPGWVRLDLGARYAMKNPASADGKITLFLNVDNVTNARYWNGAGAYSSSFLTLGLPRTVRFAVAADF